MVKGGTTTYKGFSLTIHSLYTHFSSYSGTKKSQYEKSRYEKSRYNWGGRGSQKAGGVPKAGVLQAMLLFLKCLVSQH